MRSARDSAGHAHAGAELTSATAPARSLSAVRAEPASSRGRTRVSPAHFALWAVLLALAAITVVGLPYYSATAAERVRSPLHPWLKPTGYIGQSVGVVSFALFLFLWLYPLRKKLSSLAFTGSVSRWLDLHVIAGLCIPLLAATHAAWRFTGLIGLGYGAMMVTWLSGIVGRYLYLHIPRRQSGVKMTLDEAEAERRGLLEQISATTGLEPELVAHILSAGLAPSPEADPSAPKAVLRMLTDDFRRWRIVRSLHWEWRGVVKADEPIEGALLGKIRGLALREIALSQQARMLGTTQRLFGYWHVAHRPMAISALIAVLLHVGTAVALGVTWFH